jgi:hypothetical protein
MNFLAKTRKKIVDLSGDFSGILNDRAEKFMQFLSTNADTAYSRPWHKLEQGLRKNRIRRFVTEEAERFHFTEEEQTRMFDTLMKAAEQKKLNSKSVVTYDQEQQKILEIKNFTFHKAADGTLQFLFQERKAATMKRRQSTEPKQIAPIQQQEPQQN